MTTIKANAPDDLAKLAAEAAEKEKITLDQVVALALSSQVSAGKVRDGVGSRAKRVNWHKVDEILARVPDVPPQPGDEL